MPLDQNACAMSMDPNAFYATFVCAFDDQCCSVAWDATCVSEAEMFGATCP